MSYHPQILNTLTSSPCHIILKSSTLQHHHRIMSSLCPQPPQHRHRITSSSNPQHPNNVTVSYHPEILSTLTSSPYHIILKSSTAQHHHRIISSSNPPRPNIVTVLIISSSSPQQPSIIIGSYHPQIINTLTSSPF